MSYHSVNTSLNAHTFPHTHTHRPPGTSVFLVPGGAPEVLKCQPGTLDLVGLTRGLTIGLTRGLTIV